jgi:hypothetical protein
MKLAESPVFQALKAAGATARNPLKESVDSWAKVRLILAALIGIAAGQAVVSYTGLFDALYFLQNALHLGPTLAKIIIIIEAGVGVGFNIRSAGWTRSVARSLSWPVRARAAPVHPPVPLRRGSGQPRAHERDERRAGRGHR